VSVRTLVGHHWRRHRVALGALAIGMFLFEWLMTKIAPEPSQTQAMQGIFQLLPAPLLDMLGSELTANFNARSMIGFGYAHPFPMLMMGTWAVRLSSSALAGEIGAGTMDLLASRPVPRGHLVRAALIALLVGHALIVLSGWTGTAVGLATRPTLGFGASGYLPMVLALWLLFAAFAAAGLVISALRRQGGAAMAVTTGLIAVSFAVNFVARAWRPIEWTRRFSLFMYYEPEQLYRSGALTAHTLVLAGVAAALAALAFPIFARRDL
jgi:ABC-type transport system involved in multi-copper enzyme maturation permease subunit